MTEIYLTISITVVSECNNRQVLPPVSVHATAWHSSEEPDQLNIPNVINLFP